jgi:hypothetical protein
MPPLRVNLIASKKVTDRALACGAPKAAEK